MDPKLVCRIIVTREDGEKRRVSGYPIARDRILTAAHDIVDANRAEAHASEGDARDIELFFRGENEPVKGPVFLQWNGQPAGVDVAVLRCQLPEDRQPTHRLPSQPPQSLERWIAQGYTDFAKRKRDGEPDEYYGSIPTVSGTDAKIYLPCDVGPKEKGEWAGASGSVAFEKDSQLPLAVITAFEDKGKEKGTRSRVWDG